MRNYRDTKNALKAAADNKGAEAPTGRMAERVLKMELEAGQQILRDFKEAQNAE